jgi:3-oxoacyl-[acyl-carrier protein] reductase
MEKLLANETALVTGAASGIGRGIAMALAREGAHLVLSDVDAERGEQARQACAQQGVKARFVTADLAQPASARELANTAIAALRRVSLFVHSASPKREESQTALSATDEQWDRMMNVNLRSGFVLGRELGQHMRDNATRGRMLFVTSLHAHTPRNLPHYSAAKAGETMLMKELARALGPHRIRVNAIAPGAVPGGGFAADESRLTECIALGRMGTPEDIADMAVALLSERFSRYVTGTTVVVDGGLALHNWIAPPA